jgi:hypothetical protein
LEEDGTTFTGWTYTDSIDVGSGGRGPSSARARYYPTGAKALLQVVFKQGAITFLTEFEKCPWAEVISGINSEECRSVRVEPTQDETELYEVDLATGAKRFLLSVPGREVSASGVSEAEDEMVLVELKQRYGYDYVPEEGDTAHYTYTNSFSTTDNCQVSWWSLPASQQAIPIERYRVRTQDLCYLGFDGGGTIAPVRMGHAASFLRLPVRPALR